MKQIELDSEQRQLLWRILVAAIITAAAYIPGLAEWLRIVMFGIAYVAAGYDVVWKALVNIVKGDIFDEHFLMMVATVGAFCIGDYAEAVAVMAFYQVGELFQDVAVDRSKRSIDRLMHLKPDYALIERDGKTLRVKPEDVAVGSIIVIEPGARVPVDGVVVSGESSLDTAALTGESIPVDVSVNSKVLSGSVNINGVLRVRTTAIYAESTAARILKLIADAENGKAPTERFITRFARCYTPIVCALALLLFLIPPLAGAGAWVTWLNRALIFLVISCPCALVVSIPLTFFAGIGGAARRNILVKGSTYFESLSKVKTMVFDKTGTLTEARFSVSAVNARHGVNKEQLLRMAALAESYSSHPVAQALRAAWQGDGVASDVHEYPGEGVVATIDGTEVYAGNLRLMHRAGCDAVVEADDGISGTVVYVSAGGNFLGSIEVSDMLKPEARQALACLRKEGVDNLIMLTGDRVASAAAVADEVGITGYKASLLPQEKAAAIKNLLSRDTSKEKLAFVGDGINDAPSLALADVGIAMGAIGSDAAIEAADVVVANDSLMALPEAIGISRRTMGIVWQNIIFAIAIKVGVMILAAFGMANMWWAVFADVGVTVLAVMNALRALRVPKS